MEETVLFGVIVGGFFVLRLVLATVIFLWLLPSGDRCVICNAPTVRVASRWDRLRPGLRKRWCYECGWEGLLRRGPLTPPQPRSPSSLTRKQG